MKPPPPKTRHSLELTAAQHRKLQALARKTGSTATTGPTAGKPSWRRLVARIGDGEIQIKP